MYVGDDWPKMADGSEYDGKQLLALVRNGKRPFHGAWDVNLLIQEVEESLETKVVDIPTMSKGSNYYVSPDYRQDLYSTDITECTGHSHQAIKPT